MKIISWAKHWQSFVSALQIYAKILPSLPCNDFASLPCNDFASLPCNDFASLSLQYLPAHFAMLLQLILNHIASSSYTALQSIGQSIVRALQTLPRLLFYSLCKSILGYWKSRFQFFARTVYEEELLPPLLILPQGKGCKARVALYVKAIYNRGYNSGLQILWQGFVGNPPVDCQNCLQGVITRFLHCFESSFPFFVRTVYEEELLPPLLILPQGKGCKALIAHSYKIALI